ncbi:MAG: hypothetical protein AB7S77_18350 [Desulfatirhabdiaceae bacterium]
MNGAAEWTTERLREMGQKAEQAEREKYCPNSDDEIDDDPELWPRLSPDAIHKGLIGDFITAATRYSEADAAAILGTFLTRLSVEIGRSPFMMIGDGKQHVNLLAAIAGPTGAGRKGTSAKPVERVFQSLADTYQHEPHRGRYPVVRG